MAKQSQVVDSVRTIESGGVNIFQAFVRTLANPIGAWVDIKPLGMSADNNPPPKRMAILRMTSRGLAELLQLPENAEIVEIRMPFDHVGHVEIKVSGAGWDAPEGAAILATTGAVTTQADADGNVVSKTIDWGLPQNTPGQA